ncbi:DUF2141 domain-containing protein [Bacteroidota bacterium]
MRSEKGLIRLALYDHQDQFPDEPARSFSFRKELNTDRSMEIVLDSIPKGKYVISLLDDEDENDRMDFNILRMPKEGYGFSNNTKVGLKCPPFEECSFLVTEERICLEIVLQYFKEKS